MATEHNTPEPPLPANASGQTTPPAALTPKQRRFNNITLRNRQSKSRGPGQPKAERFVTVSLHPGEAQAMPWIRLRGLWLKQAGFALQMRVRIEVQPGRLILTPESSSAAP